METKQIKAALKEIRDGRTFTHRFLNISLYNQQKDTFLVDNLNGGTSTRKEISAYSVRKLLKEFPLSSL